MKIVYFVLLKHLETYQINNIRKRAMSKAIFVLMTLPKVNEIHQNSILTFVSWKRTYKWLNIRTETSYPIFTLAGCCSILVTTLLISIIHLPWGHSWVKKFTLGRLIIQASTTARTVQHKGSKEIRFTMDYFYHNYKTMCWAFCFNNLMHEKQYILPRNNHMAK